MTHRKGEEELTEKVEKAKPGERYFVVVTHKRVISNKLSNRQTIRKMRRS